MTGEPRTTIVEWGGGDRTGRWPGVAAAGWRRLPVWALAASGAAALFGSLVADWQVLNPEAALSSSTGLDADLGFGASQIPGWGAWWIVSATVLSTLVALTLFGRPALATLARTIGGTGSVALLGVLVAATISLGEASPLPLLPLAVEFETGRGLHLAYAALILLGAALWLAPVSEPAGSDTGGTHRNRPLRSGGRWGAGAREDPVHEGPRDLSVAPATPDTLQG